MGGGLTKKVSDAAAKTRKRREYNQPTTIQNHRPNHVTPPHSLDCLDTPDYRRTLGAIRSSDLHFGDRSSMWQVFNLLEYLATYA